MTSGSLISVLMPAYNHESYVRLAVASVLNQTYPSLELIVIDDASHDGTWEAVAAYDDPRIRAVRHEVNQGAHATLNEAMKMARGQYFAILNSDDVYHAERLERLLAESAQSPEQDSLIFSDVAFIDSNGEAVAGHPRAVAYRTLRDRCAELSPSEWFLAGNPSISTSNFFFSRALADKVGEFGPLRYTHDWDWALRAAAHGAPRWLREPLLSYRVHGANTLSEDDSWRHIHENSYVQAKALMRLGVTRDPWQTAWRTTLALFPNESFHPLAVNVYLAAMLAGVGDDELLARSRGDWMLKALADDSGLPAELFRSVGFLAERERVIAAQEALIDDKDRAMEAQEALIDDKDRAMEAQSHLVEEKDRAMEAQSHLVEEKDRAIADQSRLIDEKDRTIESQARLVKEKDCAVAAQTALIDERDQYIEKLEVLAREQEEEIGSLAARSSELQARLDEMLSTRVIRLAMRVKQKLASISNFRKSL